jgi:hypothetical protein
MAAFAWLLYKEKGIWRINGTIYCCLLWNFLLKEMEVYNRIQQNIKIGS